MDLDLHSIRKRFGTRDVLLDIDCEFRKGEISTILGVSGSGKTTLLRIAAGLEEPDFGQVFLDGKDITRLTPQQRNMGFVFQDLALYSHLTVEKNLLLPLSAHGWRGESARAKISRTAAEFGLQDLLRQRAGNLSGGEGQRLALARALVREPTVTLLDEPFSHLDAPLQREARRFVFSTLKERGATAVLVTHNHQDAQEAGGSVFFIEAGRIKQTGSWESLYRRPSTPLIARVVSFLDPLEISGEIVSIDGKLCLSCPTLDLLITLDEVVGDVPAAGGHALVMMRAEDLVTGAGDRSKKHDQLIGTVIRQYSHGLASLYQLRHPSGLVFNALANKPGLPIGGEAAVPLHRVRKMIFSTQTRC